MGQRPGIAPEDQGGAGGGPAAPVGQRAAVDPGPGPPNVRSMLDDAKFTLKELEEALASGQDISADDAVPALINGIGQLRSELEQAGELIVKLERRVRMLEQSQPAQG